MLSHKMQFLFFSPPRGLSMSLTAINVLHLSTDFITEAEAEKISKLDLVSSCRKHLLENSQCNKLSNFIPAFDLRWNLGIQKWANSSSTGASHSYSRHAQDCASFMLQKLHQPWYIIPNQIFRTRGSPQFSAWQTAPANTMLPVTASWSLA